MSTPRSLATLAGSLEVSMLPKGDSTLTFSPFWETWALLAMRWMTKPQVTMPRIPMKTITATMMRMILRALLLPPLLGTAGGTGRGAETGVPGATATPAAAPHLLQNFVPSARLAPQELQNAIDHLEAIEISARRASIPQK